MITRSARVLPYTVSDPGSCRRQRRSCAGSFETVDAVLGYHALLQSELAEETLLLRKFPDPACC